MQMSIDGKSVTPSELKSYLRSRKLGASEIKDAAILPQVVEPEKFTEHPEVVQPASSTTRETVTKQEVVSEPKSKPELQHSTPVPTAAPVRQTAQKAQTIITSEKKMARNNLSQGISSFNSADYQLSQNLLQDSSLNKISEVVEALLKGAQLSNYNATIRSVPVKTDKGQNVSYLLVECVDDRTKPTAVGFTAIVLASSLNAVDLPTHRFTARNANGMGDSTFDIKMSDSDVCDAYLLELITERIGRTYPGIAKERRFLAEPTVLPRVFNFSDPDQIRRILINAINAANLRLRSGVGAALGFEDFTLEGRNTVGTEDVEVVFTNDVQVDDVGLPRRADLRVIIANAQQNRNDRAQPTINGDTAAEVQAEVGAYIDLAWNCEAAPTANLMSGLGGVAPQMSQSIPKMYTPRVIITSQRTTQIRSLSMQMLAIMTMVSALHEGNDRRIREYFVTAAKATTGNGTPANPYRDLQGIGYELFPLITGNTSRGPLETRGEAASAEWLMNITAAIFHQAVYAIDIPEFGPDSWTLTPFLSAATGNDAAITEIHNALEFLTGGAYGRIIEKEMNGIYPNPCFHDNNRLHGGFYQDPITGQPGDLRNFDYLMFLNRYGAEQEAQVTAWSQSMYASSSSREQRVAHRWNQIMETSAGSAVQTHWIVRVGFNSTFLDIARRAIREAGYSPNFRDTQLYTGNEARINAHFLNVGSMNSQVQFFNQTAPGNANRFGMGGMMTRFDQFTG